MTDTVQSKARHIDEAEFESVVKAAGSKPVFVDFYAEWCGPCKLAAPEIDKMVAEYKDKAEILKVDVDANNGLAKQYGVMSIPTVIVFKNEGSEIVKLNTLIGYRGPQAYRQMLDEALGK